MRKFRFWSGALVGGLVAHVGTFGCSGASEPAEPAAGATFAGNAAVTGGRAGGLASSGGSAAGSNSNGGVSALGGAAAVSAGASNGGASAASGATAAGGASAAGGSAASGGAASTADGTGAPEVTPLGYGKNATGGGSAKPVKVATLAEMQAAIDAYPGSGGLVLEYTGKFDFASISDPCVQHTLPAQIVEIKSKSEISVIGADGSAANFGIHVAAASNNVIIRNMTMALTPGGSDSDLISIEGMSAGFPTNVWIDHNELFTSLATCAGAGDTAFDGMIDMKKGADNITVSYNYMHDHHKVSLNGFTDDDAAVRHVTFHHNLFEKVGSRLPLQRHGYSHVLNNYFHQVLTSGINVRMGGYSLVEANYFEGVVDPVTARDSPEVGFWDLRRNNLASTVDVAPGNRFGITWTNGSAGTVNATSWTTSAAYPVDLGYSYKADPFQCIHDGLRAAAGAGKALATLKCK